MTISLPTHPRTGVTAIGLRRDGEPIWPISGASEPAPEPPPAPVPSPPAPTPPAPPASAPQPKPADEPLGEPGKKALDAERKARADAEKELAKLRKAEEDRDLASKSELEQAQTRLAKAEKTAQAALDRAVKAEIKASATGWADPSDAPRYLDDMSKYVNAQGEIDGDAINADLAKILDSKPHLGKGSATPPAPTPGKTPQPDPSQGARGDVKTRPTSLGEAVRSSMTKA